MINRLAVYGISLLRNNYRLYCYGKLVFVFV